MRIHIRIKEFIHILMLSRDRHTYFLLPYLALLLVLPLVGMARNFFLHLDGCARARILCLDPLYSCLLIPEEKKNIWSELALNPGPLASRTQATALTT